MTNAYKDGQQCFRDGHGIEDNPYDYYTQYENFVYWEFGFLSEQEAYVAEKP